MLQKINARTEMGHLRYRTYPLAFSPKASNRVLLAGLLTYSVISAFPNDSVAK